MVILHYIPSISKAGGGVSAYLQLLATDLGKLVDLHIVCHHSEGKLDLTNCHIHYIDNGIKNYRRAKKQFVALLDNIHPNLVHVNGCWTIQCSWVTFWAKEKGLPVITSPHGMLEPWVIKKNYWTKKLPGLLIYQKKSVQMSDMLVATAQSEKDNLINLGYNKNVAVVPNGIIVDDISCKTSWKERKKILFLALYRKNKGIDLLMEAIALKHKLFADWTVTIAGMDSDYTVADLKQMAASYGISDIVDVVGPLFGEEKWNAYREADVFVLPTLNENFGIVIAEALLSGTPVITTKGAPWPEISEKCFGWWINRTVNDLTNALISFTNTSVDERKQMGLRGRKFVIDNYASDRIAKEMYAAYKRLLTVCVGGVNSKEH